MACLHLFPGSRFTYASFPSRHSMYDESISHEQPEDRDLWFDFVLMLVHVLPSAEPMADSAAASQSQVTQEFSWFIDVLLRGIVDPLLCRTRMNRSSALTVMRICFGNEVVLGAKRAVAEQTPAHNLALVCKEVPQHLFHSRRELDWHFNAQVAQRGFLTLFGLAHGCFPVPWQRLQTPVSRQATHAER